MKLEDFRSDMWGYREDAAARAAEFKDSAFVERRLQRLYGSFDRAERAMADVVISEWLVSSDQSVRFDARSLIRDFKIVGAVPMLERLASILKRSHDVSARDELDMVERLITFLCEKRSEVGE